MSLVIIKGAGDLATGIAHRLFQSGFQIAMTEVNQPTVVRRTVAFAQAIFSGEATVEGVKAKHVEHSEITATLSEGIIPVVIDPMGQCISELRPCAVVDAIIAKCNLGTTLNDAPIVIGVGPGFTAGVDVGAVVETVRGHDMGRVYYQGCAIANTGIPGEVGGYSIERLIKSPAAGKFNSLRAIGDTVSKGDVVGEVSGVEVKTAISGVLRGLIRDGLMVKTGMKIGDVDPRCNQEHCFTISDKGRAIGGGVLEAILHFS